MVAAAPHIVAAQNDLTTLQAYCYARATENIDEVVATLEEVCWRGTTGVAQRAIQFSFLAHYKETRERQRLTSTPHNAASLDDWPFLHVTKELEIAQELARKWLELKPNSYSGLVALAQALLATNSFETAEASYAVLRSFKKGDLVSVVNFDPAFHDALGAAAEYFKKTSNEVIPVRKGRAGACRVLFTACDYNYLKMYGWPLMASIAKFPDADTAFHLHVFDATEDEAEAVAQKVAGMGIDNFSISREWTNLRNVNTAAVSDSAKNYYHTARYPRFWQFLEDHPEATAWLLDTDLLFVHSPEALYHHIAGDDLALMLMPGRFEAHNKIAAGVLGVAGTPKARDFLRRVAGYIAQCLKADTTPWGTDQTALYAVFSNLLAKNAAPTIAPVPAALYDGDPVDSRVIWPGKYSEKGPEYPRFKAYLRSLETA